MKKSIPTLLIIGVFLISSFAIGVEALEISQAQLAQPSISSLADKNVATTQTTAQQQMAVAIAASNTETDNALLERARAASDATPSGYVMLFRCMKKVQHESTTYTTHVLGDLDFCIQRGMQVVSEPGEAGYAFKEQSA